MSSFEGAAAVPGLLVDRSGPGRISAAFIEWDQSGIRIDSGPRVTSVAGQLGLLHH